MPQLQNLVLTDREATPVNHTFTPLGILNGVAYVTESSGVPLGENRLSIVNNKTATGRYKISIKMELPIVQTQIINGVSSPVVVRKSYVDVSFTFDPSSTEQERKNVLGLIASALSAGKTLIEDTVVKLQGVF